jgi:lactam utilization protein B
LLPPAKSKKATPSQCAERVTNLSTSSDIQAEVLKGKSYSVCLHSDMEGALDNVKAVRTAIDNLNANVKA